MRRALIFLGLAFFIMGGRAIQQQIRSFINNPHTTQRDNQGNLQEITLESRIQNGDRSALTHAELGLAYLQRVRETGDAAYYLLAENALNQAIAIDANEVNALIGQGMLAAARHEFVLAIEWGEKARRLNRYSAPALGILVDSHVELGNYEQAVETVDQMVALRPDLQSYSRLSYVRELFGDVDGAIQAMDAAVNAGLPGSEEMLWSLVQLGDLHLRYSDRESDEVSGNAATVYQQALQLQPTYPYAIDGLARVAMADKEYHTAIALYEPLVERLPLPQFAWSLGDAYTAINEDESAQEAYDLVRTVQKLNEAAGMNVDLELILFDIEHGGDIKQTVQNAQAVYEKRQSIFAADALAWALYHNGQYDEAKQYSDVALRLGTADPILHKHAEQIMRYE